MNRKLYSTAHSLRLPLAIAALFALSPVAAPAQSFDCRAARTADEMTICENSELARLDQQLATAYRRDVGQLAPNQREAFQQNEIAFVNARHRCGEDRRCIAQSYRNRIQELQSLLGADARTRVEPAQAEDENQPEPRGDQPSRRKTASPIRGETKAAATPPAPEPPPVVTSAPHKSETTIVAVPSRQPEPPPPTTAGSRKADTAAATTQPGRQSETPASTVRHSETSVTTTIEHRPEASGSTMPERSEAPRVEPAAKIGAAHEEIAEPKKPARKAHHEAKHSRATTVATTTTAEPAPGPAPAASGSTVKPTIQWANPPPAH